jgi:hypothetical protein
MARRDWSRKLRSHPSLPREKALDASLSREQVAPRDTPDVRMSIYSGNVFHGYHVVDSWARSGYHDVPNSPVVLLKSSSKLNGIEQCRQHAASPLLMLFSTRMGCHTEENRTHPVQSDEVRDSLSWCGVNFSTSHGVRNFQRSSLRHPCAASRRPPLTSSRITWTEFAGQEILPAPRNYALELAGRTNLIRCSCCSCSTIAVTSWSQAGATLSDAADTVL